MLKWRISLATRVRFFEHSVTAAAVSNFFFFFLKFQLEKNVFIYLFSMIVQYFNMYEVKFGQLQNNFRNYCKYMHNDI